MDGVLADVEQQFLDWYHRDFGIRYDRDYLIGKDNHNAFHEPGIMRKFVVSPGFFLDIPVMTGAVEAVQKLMEKYEVYIVSAAMEFPLSLPEKLSWLNLHFPFIGWKNIIFCGDKSIINTDYMIDDYPKNLDTFKGKPIMFTAHHNTELTHHTRVNNWADVLDLFNAEPA